MKKTRKGKKQSYSRIVAMILAVLMVFTATDYSSLLLVYADETSDSTIYVMPSGTTLNLENVPDSCKILKLNTDGGEYTFTGKFATRKDFRIQIDADCTVNFDNMSLNSIIYLLPDKSYYLGGTQGVVEIADGKTVDLHLIGDNEITNKRFYNIGMNRTGILLGADTTLNISGNGSLDAGCIGRRNPQESMGSAHLTLKSGYLDSQLGNVSVKQQDGYWQQDAVSECTELVFTYEGGTFHNICDDPDQYYPIRNTTVAMAIGDVQRVTIPTTGLTRVKRGIDGSFTETGKSDNNTYVWLDTEDIKNNQPIYYYAQFGEEYHRYKFSTSSYSARIYTAVLADDPQVIGGVSGTLKSSFGDGCKGAKISFTSTNGDGTSFSCTTDTDGSYDCNMPAGTYTMNINVDGENYPGGNVTVTEEKHITHSIILPCVRGKVTDTANEPLENTAVMLKYNTIAKTLLTDTNGEYCFFFPTDIDDMKFDIAASKWGYETSTVSKTLGSSGSQIDFSLTENTDLSNITITTEGDLINLSKLDAEALNGATINLYADINMSDNSTFTSIKAQYNIIFNGNGHRIDNLKCPLFEEVGSNNLDCTKITSFFLNLHLSGDIDIDETTKKEAVGAFCRVGSSLAFENCSFGISSEGDVKNSLYVNGLPASETDYAGGFVGYSGEKGRPITLKNCAVNMTIAESTNQYHPNYVGGFIGFTKGTITVDNCFVRCIDAGETLYIGGVAGYVTNLGGVEGNLAFSQTSYVRNTYVNQIKGNGVGNEAKPITKKSYNNLITNGTYINTDRSSGVASDAYATSMKESSMTALPGTEGALIDLLNEQVTQENGYATWYLQSDGFPGFTETKPVTVTGGKAAFTSGEGNGATVYYAPGETVTVTAEVPEGKYLSGWTVTTGKITLTETNETTATFIMPDTAVELTANFADLTQPIFTEEPTITGTYGEKVSEMKLNGTVPGETGVTAISDNGVAGTWTITDSNKDQTPVVGTTNTYEVTFTPTDIKQYAVITKNIVPTVDKKDITVIIGDVERKYGQDNPSFKFSIMDGFSLVEGDTDAVLDITLQSAATTTSNVETYDIIGSSGSGNTNYNVTFETGTLTVKQETGTLAVPASLIDKTFGDGTFSLGCTTNGDGVISYLSSDTSVATVDANGSVTIHKAGTAEITVSLASGINYTAAADKSIIISVDRKTATTPIEQNRTYVYSAGSGGNTVSIDLAALLPTDRGATTYSLAANGAAYVTDGVVNSVGTLTYKVGTNGNKNDSTSLVVTAVSDNYADITVNVNIDICDKLQPVQKTDAIVAINGSNVLTYGQKLSTLILNNTSAVFVEQGTSTIVNGTLTWNTPDATPVYGTASAEWTFTPSDTNTYSIVTGTLDIVVNKAEGTVSDSATSKYKTTYTYTGTQIAAPTASNFTTNCGSTVFTFTWYKDSVAEDNKLAAGTRPSAKGNYVLKVDTAATANYTAGTITVPVTIESFIPDPVVKATLADTNKGSDGWYHGDVTILAPIGFTISKTQDSGSFGTTTSLLVNADQNSNVTYYLKEIATGYITDAMTIEVKKDTVFATAKITVKESWWDHFLEIVTSCIYTRDMDTITIDAADTNGVVNSGIASIEYLISCESYEGTEGLNNLKAVADDKWTAYQNGNKPHINQNEENYIYVRVRDKAGNVAYVSTDDIVQDTVAPVLEVQLSGTTYRDIANNVDIFKSTATATVTALDEAVSGKNTLASIKYKLDNGTETTITSGNSIVISGQGSHVLLVTAVDQAGNETSEQRMVRIYADSTEVAIIPATTIIYDGSAIEEGTDFVLTKGGSAGAVSYSYKVKESKDDTYVDGLPINAGNYTIKANVAEDAVGFYPETTQTTDVTITKAIADAPATIKNNYDYAAGSEGETVSIDIAALLPIDRGTTTYSLSTNSAAYVTDEAVDIDGKLTYKVGTNGNNGDATSLVVKAVSDNYTDITVTVEVTLDHEVNASEPQIEGDDSKKGWDVIEEIVDKSEDGDTVTIDMNGATTVPGYVIESIKGNDVTIIIKLENGITWKVNGTSVTTDSIKDHDFGVTIGTSTIPVDVINEITGEKSSIQISLSYNGEFGFTATLNVNLEEKNAGLYANLFYYNKSTGKLEFMNAGRINADGTVDLTFTHASDYTIVISDVVMDGTDAGETVIVQTGEKTDLWKYTWFIVLSGIILIIGFGTIIVKKRKETDITM